MNIPKDLHICGICKKVFNNIKLFLDHKTKCFLPQNGELSPNPHDVLLENGLFPCQTVLDLTVSDNGSFPFFLEYDNEEVISDINPLQVQEDNQTQNELSQIFASHKLSDINEDDVATLLVTQLSKEVNESHELEVNQETEDENIGEISSPYQASQKIESAAKQNEQSNTSTAEKETISEKKKPKNACNICDFVASNNQVLERHIRKHTGERPFTCCICNKKFARQDKLVVHKRIHFGDKRYRCQLCEYATTDGAALRKHLQIHTDERPHKCQMCSYRARNASHMTVHLRTHTGDSPFFCQVETCGRTFKTSTDLKRHMKVHKLGDMAPTYSFEDLFKKFSCKHSVKNGKPVKRSTSCRICQDFVEKSNVGIKKRKQGARKRGRRALCMKAHKCPQCDTAFVRPDSLRSHLRQHELSSPPLDKSLVVDRDGLEELELQRTSSPELTSQNISAAKNSPVLLFVDNSDLQDSILPIDQDGTVRYIMENSFL